MSGNKIYQGRFAELLRAFIEEKRSLGCRYKEEERLSFIFDQLSLNYDCSDGLTAELADAFTGYQPNWQATTQKRRISFLPWPITSGPTAATRIFSIRFSSECFMERA